MDARRAVFCAVLSVMCVVIVISTGAQTNDDPSVTAQLNSVKPLLANLSKDASQMATYTMKRGLSWDTHSENLTRMKNDVNKLQESMRGLPSHRANASPRQQDAIDRIVALANDLATSMNSTIDTLNKSKSKPTGETYQAYLKANEQIVNALRDEINGIIDYAVAKQKMDSLQKQIE